METAAQLDYLRLHGCDEIQGYYFSQPVPAAVFERMLAEGRNLLPAPADPRAAPRPA